MCDPPTTPTLHPAVTTPPAPPASAPIAAAEPDPAADRMLAAARQGSNRAWAALLQRLDPSARSLAHLVLGGDGVDEVLLAAYVRAYRARRKGPDDAAVFLGHHVWIACGHEIRRRQRREDPAPGRRAQRHDRPPRLGTDAMGQAVAALGPEERAVWGLCVRGDMPAGRAAATLGVTDEVVMAVAERVGARVAERLEMAAEPATLAETQPVDDLPAAAASDEAAPPPLGAGDDTVAMSEVVDLTDAPDGPEGSRAPDQAVDPEPVETEPIETEAAATTSPPDPHARHDDGSLEPSPPTKAFWAELGRRLRAEREALPAAPPPALPEPGDPSPALVPAKAPPVAMQKRAPARIRKRRPDLVEELADEADRQRTPRDWTSTLLRGAALVLVVGVIAAVVVVAYTTAANSRSPVRENSVASVAGGSMDVLARSQSWSATVVRTATVDGQTGEATLDIVSAANGSYRISEPATGRLTTYEARLGVARDTAPGFPVTDLAGMAPGPPDRETLVDNPISDLGVAARVFAESTDEEATRETRAGRAVWVMEGELDGATSLTYVVDVDGLLPVELIWTTGLTVVRALEFRDVRLDADLAAFTQDLPEGGEPPVDAGFDPVSITDVTARVDLRPPTPDYLPTGFVFTGVAVEPDARIVSLRYARGPAQVVITLRPSPVEAGNPWDDPFPRDGEVTATEVTLGSGPFREAPARQVSGGAALPSLWVADGERALTVAGDLSPDQLLEVARSIS